MYQPNSTNEEESLFESDYITSVLSVVNGYCKINLEVPQTSQFYKSSSLLPINAKCVLLNNTNNKSQIDNTISDITSILKKKPILKVNENMEYFDNKMPHLPNKISADCAFQTYSDHCDPAETKDFLKLGDRKKKKNKFNKVDVASTSFDEPNLNLFTNVSPDQNASKDIENEQFLDDGFQEQKLQRKQMNNTISMLKSQPLGSLYASKSGQNNILQHKSQCPLCFKFFPTSEIETHASECSI